MFGRVQPSCSGVNATTCTFEGHPHPRHHPNQCLLAAHNETIGNLPVNKEKQWNTITLFLTSPNHLQQNNFLRPSCKRESGVMHDGGRALALFTHGRREKRFSKRNQQLSLPLSPPCYSPSLGSLLPSTSPSLASWICNDCAAQHGRVWRRLISQAGTTPLHPRQKQTCSQGFGSFCCDYTMVWYFGEKWICFNEGNAFFPLCIFMSLITWYFSPIKIENGYKKCIKMTLVFKLI